jgi:CoA:oxalate CoA-transferase
VAKPLDGLVVLDLTRVLAGPFAGMLLADFGADVIKVENPKGGDDARAYTPFQNGESAYFISLNRGKRSLTLNLKAERGKEIFRELAKRADILVENYKPGTMEKLGLGYEALREINPRLVYAASSGFGRTGPYSAFPAYDVIIQGMGGLMSITGPDKEHPTKVGSSVADIFAGVFTVVGILMALRARERTGRGQMVDVAMLDCMVAVLENAITQYVVKGTIPEPIGNIHPAISPFMTLRSRDGFLNVACGNDELWKRFAAAVGAEELLEDPRFFTNAGRVEDRLALREGLEVRTVERTTEEWIGLLRGIAIPCGPIANIAQVVADPQVIARNMIVELDQPKAGPLRVPGTPIKLSETPGEVKVPAPLLSQHTEEILVGWLGMGAEEVAELREQGVL